MIGGELEPFACFQEIAVSLFGSCFFFFIDAFFKPIFVLLLRFDISALLHGYVISLLFTRINYLHLSLARARRMFFLLNHK